MTKNSHPVNFDSIAPVYDLLASLVFGKTIRNTQRHYLSVIPDHARILIIGGGSGWILTDILLRKKNLRHITYLEASSVMLDLASKKLTTFKALPTESQLPVITFRHGTEDDIPADDFYDVVITNFFLDLFDEAELQEVMKKLSAVLHPEGIWLFSDFNICNQPVNAWWQRLLVRSMYWFFRITCQLTPASLPDFKRAFHQHGWIQTQSKYFFHEMMVTKVFRRAVPP